MPTGISKSSIYIENAKRLVLAYDSFGEHENRRLQDGTLPQQDGSWVAEIPAIAGCYALMDTREAALAELSNVFGISPTNIGKKA